MSKSNWLRRKYKHRYLHLIFYLLHEMYVPNFKSFFELIQKEVTNVLLLEVGIYELIQLKLLPFQIIPELLQLLFVGFDSNLIKSFCDLLGTSKDSLKLKLIANEVVYYIDLIRNGSMLKDNLKTKIRTFGI